MDEFHKYNIEAKESKAKKKKAIYVKFKSNNINDSARYQDNDYPWERRMYNGSRIGRC